MPDLLESLQGRDLGHLQIVARMWGVDLDEQRDQPAVVELTSILLNPSKIDMLVGSLPVEASEALKDLTDHGGRLPWAQFVRTYGELREMGTAKRDRERPYDKPVSAVEILWYRALVAKSFFDTPSGPEEFAYIPDDLLEHIAAPTSLKAAGLGRPASASEYATIYPANDRLLDHTCTLLAALRMGIDVPSEFQSPTGEVLAGEFLESLLAASDLLDKNRSPRPEPARMHLEARRGDAMLQLFRAWKGSEAINELALLPELALEGNWKNDPQESRQKLLKYLASIPVNSWWSLASFISAIKQQDPDFQRPAGDYDSWFIRSKLSGEYLRGFEHWDAVDGRLLRFLICGPLYWLGIVDLASAGEGEQVTAFRLSRWSQALLNDRAPTGIPAEDGSLLVRSDARVSAGRLVPRRVRYQVARFCEWVKETPEDYQYRISPASLSAARKQGLKVSQLVTLVNRSARAVPPSLIKALERWDQQGAEARLEKMVVLRVVSGDILQALRKSRAGRYLGESVGPTAVAIKPGAVDKVLGVLTELGYLGETRIDKD